MTGGTCGRLLCDSRVAGVQWRRILAEQAFMEEEQMTFFFAGRILLSSLALARRRTTPAAGGASFAADGRLLC